MYILSYHFKRILSHEGKKKDKFYPKSADSESIFGSLVSD